jgi:hypothetical protein
VDNGYWLSSNADVLKINKHSGEAYAVGPGSALGKRNSEIPWRKLLLSYSHIVVSLYCSNWLVGLSS